MAITISPIPAFQDNYIWLLRLDDRNYVVDPGDAVPVIERLSALRVDLTGILVTHHHWDHTGGILALKERYPQVVVWGPYNETIQGIDHPLKGGDTLKLSDYLSFKIIAVPGHTLDHIAYFATPEESDPVLLCGDTLFSSGCGRLFEGTPQQMAHSLSLLSQLPDATQVFCTHEYTTANLAFAAAVEPDNADIQARIRTVAQLRADHQPSLPSSIALEKAVNPFLRCSTETVRQRAKQRLGHPSELSDVDVFTALRAWKDHF